MSNISKRESTKTLVLGAIMTAMVVILQTLATYTKFFGAFSSAVALIPIVIGAVMCGPAIGAWLGLVFGVVVMVTGGAAPFDAVDIGGTVVTVLVKGTVCGLASGVVYKLLEKWNKYVAAVAAAIVCPVVNTGIFLLGCAVFFMDDVSEIVRILTEAGMTISQSGFEVFIWLAMANFLFELLSNAVLSPIIIRLMKIRKKRA